MKHIDKKKSSGSTFAVILLQLVLAILLGGCAGYRPIAVGPGYFGLGAYKDYRDEKKMEIPHIDLKGTGILFVNNKVIIGYSKLSILYSSEKLKDNRIKLSQAEIAFGEEAEKMALEIQKKSKEGGKR